MWTRGNGHPGPLYFKVPDDCVCGKGKPFPITKSSALCYQLMKGLLLPINK